MGPRVRHVPDRRNSSGGLRAIDRRTGKLKKLEEAGGDKEGTPAGINLDTVILAGLERGLTMADIKAMQLGQVVDFCIEYNKRQEEGEKAAEKQERRRTKRKATQSDIDSFFG